MGQAWSRCRLLDYTVGHCYPQAPLLLRTLWLSRFLANLALLAFGQGLLGPLPSDQGREARMLSERNQQVIQLGEPQASQ